MGDRGGTEPQFAGSWVVIAGKWLPQMIVVLCRVRRVLAPGAIRSGCFLTLVSQEAVLGLARSYGTELKSKLQLWIVANPADPKFKSKFSFLLCHV